MTDPIRYTPDLEHVEPDEGQTVEALNEQFDIILETTSENYGRAVRSVHAKAHGIVEGVLTVEPDLPPELSQGLFAVPGNHPVFMRFSTNPGDILTDAISLPRGLAIKVMDVDGPRLSGADGRTQDFVMVNGPVFQAKDAEAFLGNLKMLARTTDKAEGAKVALSTVLRGVNVALTAVGIESAAVRSMGGAPNVDPIGETYFSATPFRYGDYVAKFKVVPVAPALQERTGAIIDASERPNVIRETLQRELRDIDGEWEFRVQLQRDTQKQPIEDPTVEWTEEEAPSVKVATIRTKAQDSWDPARVQRVNEELRFSVWTGLAAHQPLGNINRSRKQVYEHSAAFRARVNGCPIHEPA